MSNACRMEYKDFLANFTTLEICHLPPGQGGQGTQTMHGKAKKCWHVVTEYSEWRRNVSAGGCKDKKMINPFHINPQFHVTLTVPEEGKNLCTLFVGLMQKDNRAERKKTGMPLQDIGFMVYQVRNNRHKIIIIDKVELSVNLK